MITTDANKLLRPIHDRMPLILEPLAARQWLDAVFTSMRMLSVLMQPFPSELMETYEVSRLVNDPKNDSPTCIAPTIPEPLGPRSSTDRLKGSNGYGYARIKGYFTDGTARMVHPFDPSWYPGGNVLRQGPGSSIIEVARFELPSFTLELKGVAKWFGFELSKLVVDECLNV